MSQLAVTTITTGSATTDLTLRTANGSGATLVIPSSGAITLSAIYFGNTTANVVANSTMLQVANSSGTANLQPTQLKIGTTTVNSTFVQAASINAAALFDNGAVVLTASDADQVISGGARVTMNDLGNLSGASITPDPGDRPMQKVTNNGAGSILPGSNEGNYLLSIVNTTGAGAITTTGWTLKGDSLDTTTTSRFLCHCTVTTDIKLMSIVKVV